MTNEQRQHLLAYLGYYVLDCEGDWGSGSREACKEFQRDRNITPVDGIGGPITDKELKYAVFNDLEKSEPIVEDNTPATGTWWSEIEFFTPAEMACKCGGQYCNGYPHEIQPLLMQILDRARRWSGHPIQIISGLRCPEWNRIQKGVSNSQHQYGEAADVYFYGVSPNAALAWFQSQPDVRYAYRIEGSNNIHVDIQPVGR